MALIVPLSPLPAQILNVVLNGQNCTLKVYQRFWGLFMDVITDSTNVVVQGVICQNVNFIVRDFYLGFSGDFHFFDLKGTSDPYYTGLGTQVNGRFVLIYNFPSELPDDYGQGPFDVDTLGDPSDFLTAFPNANLPAVIGTPE